MENDIHDYLDEDLPYSVEFMQNVGGQYQQLTSGRNDDDSLKSDALNEKDVEVPMPAECLPIDSESIMCGQYAKGRYLNISALSQFYNRVDGGDGKPKTRDVKLTITSVKEWNELVVKMTDGSLKSWTDLILPLYPCAATDEPLASSPTGPVYLRYLETMICTRDIFLISRDCNKATSVQSTPCSLDQNWCEDYATSVSMAFLGDNNFVRSMSKEPADKSVNASLARFCPYNSGLDAIEILNSDCMDIAHRLSLGRKGAETESSSSQKSAETKKSDETSSVEPSKPVALCSDGGRDFVLCGFSLFPNPVEAKTYFCKIDPSAPCCNVALDAVSGLKIQQNRLSDQDTSDDQNVARNKTAFAVGLGVLAAVIVLVIIAVVIVFLRRKRRRLSVPRGVPRGRTIKKSHTVGLTPNNFKVKSIDDWKPGGLYVSIHPYHPQLVDELELLKDDVVEVTSIFDDGWCKAYNFRSRQKGQCPLACLHQDSSLLSPAVNPS
ncbi:hypothetical protein HDU97_010151 [Phlyctochytrium planicorne]|nr:hypothetical protein HDU97_010151 [Phlyctochytrium planicorne]